VSAVPPSLVLVLLVVLASAFAFHAAVGRDWRGLGLAVVAALAGFVAGEAVARALGHDLGAVGSAHMLHGLAGTWLAMIVAWRQPR